MNNTPLARPSAELIARHEAQMRDLYRQQAEKRNGFWHRLANLVCCILGA